MDFHDFTRRLGKSGSRSQPPPQVVCKPRSLELITPIPRLAWDTGEESQVRRDLCRGSIRAEVRVARRTQARDRCEYLAHRPRFFFAINPRGVWGP